MPLKKKSPSSYSLQSNAAAAEDLCNILDKHLGKNEADQVEKMQILITYQSQDMKGKADDKQLDYYSAMLQEVIKKIGSGMWQGTAELAVKQFLQIYEVPAADETIVGREAYKFRLMLSHCLRARRQPKKNPSEKLKLILDRKAAVSLTMTN